MARSETIWLVQLMGETVLPIAAFTVKHELITWLKRHREGWPKYVIFRMADNPGTGDYYQPPKTLAVSELVPDAG